MSALDWSGAIKITFDKKITNDPAIITGSEYYKEYGGTASVPDASGYYSSYIPKNAFDGSASTYWRASSTASPQWIGNDFGVAITLARVVVRMDYASGRINAYELKGSNDNTNWTTVTTGNFTNVSGDQNIDFAAATYRYWRLYAISKFSSYFTITEMSFYNIRNTYNVAGWAASAQEHDMSPEGTLITKQYQIYKVEKSVDELSVTLWLNMPSRMWNPVGVVSVNYDKDTGNLVGLGNIQVEDFTITFTPTGITPVFNPHDAERINLSVTATTLRKLIFYEDYKEDEHISLTVSVTAIRYHINDIPQ